MSGSSSKLNALIAVGGLSLPASTMLTNLSLDSTASFDPLYYLILAVGAGLFAISLITLYSQKHEPTQVVWQIISVAFAAGIFVSWTKYESFFLSIGASALVIFGIVAAAYFMRQKLADQYHRNRIPIYIALALITLVPVAIAVQNIGPQPIVSISSPPHESAAYLWGNTNSSDVSLTIKAAQANAEHIILTATSPTNSLPVYLNDTAGPCDLGNLARTQSTVCLMTITALPTVQSMTWYNITLTAKYNNFLGQSIQKTVDYPVYTGPPTAGPPPGLTNYWLIITLAISFAESIFYYVFFFKIKK